MSQAMEVLESTYTYHIYNRGNGKQNIFIEKENYSHFLDLLKKYITPISEVFCYCLLPNHFHVLLRIKDDVEDPSQKFSNLFNAYTKAINKRYSKVGSLFQRPFKRIRVTDEFYLKQLILYIHLNPGIHGIANFEKYPYSSFASILSTKSTLLQRTRVLEIFDSHENFLDAHRLRNSIIKESRYALE